jgi:hypothetical protein
VEAKNGVWRMMMMRIVDYDYYPPYQYLPSFPRGGCCRCDDNDDDKGGSSFLQHRSMGVLSRPIAAVVERTSTTVAVAAIVL